MFERRLSTQSPSRRPWAGSVRRCAAVATFVTVLGVATSNSFGQPSGSSATEYTIKAAYLYNFIRYVEWPSTAFADAESPIVIGVVGPMPPDMARSLAFYQKTKKIRGRPIRVRRFATAAGVQNCHLLFLTKSIERKLLREILQQIAKSPTLLVGETTDSFDHGCAICFTNTSNRVGFQLALKKTKSKGLKPSARLLQVAKVTD